MPSLRCYPSHGFIVGGYGIPAIPTPPSDIPPTELTEFTEAFGVEEPPTDFTDAHRWLGCVGFSHGFHGIHRSFWRKIFSHRFHRCAQMVRLHRLLWKDSLVSAWVWQGCHTLLICAHPCNLWETILRQKLLWVLWFLWEDSLVSAWVWQGCHTLLICAHPCNLWEALLRQKIL